MTRIVEEYLGVKRQSDADQGPHPPLTGRERQVLARIARGLTNRQIALELQVSIHTVKRDVATLLRKLGLPGRLEAAVYAARAGLLDTEAEQPNGCRS
jgi:DNA-binding NarL/FixJ family response regulator